MYFVDFAKTCGIAWKGKVKSVSYETTWTPESPGSGLGRLDRREVVKVGFEDFENANMLAKKAVEHYAGGWYWSEIPPVQRDGKIKDRTRGITYGYFGGGCGPWEKDFYDKCELRVIVELFPDGEVLVTKLSH